MNNSVCFTGHRTIKADIAHFSIQLTSVIEHLITKRGITDFYAEGAYGFDTLASLSVLKLRDNYPQVKLHLILPCSNLLKRGTDGGLEK